MLVREIYQQLHETKPSFEFLKLTLPVILDRAVSDKTFIKTEARAALKALEKNGFNDQVMSILCERSFDKNVNISELAFATICAIASEGKENWTKSLSQHGLQVLFESIAKAINGKRAVMKKEAETLTTQFKSAFSENQMSFESFLTSSLKLKEGDVSTIMQTFAEKKKNSNDFASFLKQQKNSNPGTQEKVEHKFDMVVEDQ